MPAALSTLLSWRLLQQSATLEGVLTTFTPAFSILLKACSVCGSLPIDSTNETLALTSRFASSLISTSHPQCINSLHTQPSMAASLSTEFGEKRSALLNATMVYTNLLLCFQDAKLTII
jgi:hypothetical protein